jgi:hypothetical protein
MALLVGVGASGVVALMVHLLQTLPGMLTVIVGAVASAIGALVALLAGVPPLGMVAAARHCVRDRRRLDADVGPAVGHSEPAEPRTAVPIAAATIGVGSSRAYQRNI